MTSVAYYCICHSLSEQFTDFIHSQADLLRSQVFLIGRLPTLSPIHSIAQSFHRSFTSSLIQPFTHSIPHSCSLDHPAKSEGINIPKYPASILTNYFPKAYLMKTHYLGFISGNIIINPAFKPQTMTIGPHTCSRRNPAEIHHYFFAAPSHLRHFRKCFLHENSHLCCFPKIGTNSASDSSMKLS